MNEDSHLQINSHYNLNDSEVETSRRLYAMKFNTPAMSKRIENEDIESGADQ